MPATVKVRALPDRLDCMVCLVSPLPLTTVTEPLYGFAAVGANVTVTGRASLGDTRALFVIGEVVNFHFRDGLCVDGKIPTEALKPICRLGGPKYARLGEIVSMPPVGRTEQMVVFAADERVDSRN